MKTIRTAALAAALIFAAGTAAAQIVIPPVTPPVIEALPLPGTSPAEAPVKAGTIFAAGTYNQAPSPAWPVATIQAGTTLTYALNQLFTFGSGQSTVRCDMNTSVNAVALAANGGNAYAGSYSVNAAGGAGVALAYTGKTFGLPGTVMTSTGGTGLMSAGNSTSTLSFTFNAPGTYLLSVRPTIASSGDCNAGSLINPATGLQTTATTVVQVVSAADYALPVTGWYWDPNQGGRGVAIEYYPSNGRIFMGIFGYGNSGESSWLVGACTYNAASKTCAGNLDSHRGGVTLAQKEGPLSTMVGSTGQFTLTFNQRNQPTLQWTGPTINLVRYTLSGASTDANMQSAGIPGGAALANGWYWNETTGGRGWFVETARKPNGTIMTFTVGFMYRPDGSPVWYALEAGSTANAAPALFEGASFKEFTGGSSMTAQTWSPTITNADVAAGSLLAGNGTLAVNTPAGTIPLTKFTVQ